MLVQYAKMIIRMDYYAHFSQFCGNITILANGFSQYSQRKTAFQTDFMRSLVRLSA
jgi:hypothetical protein